MLELKVILVIIQLTLLAAQIGCGIYAGVRSKDAFDVLGGFAIWGFAPNLLLCLLVVAL